MRVLCVTGLRGQDVANKLFPGLGYFVAFMIVLGGLVFNIGNVGGVMIVVILVVKPPVGDALRNTFLPSAGVNNLVPAILTHLGGTVGGYITFSGAHRLIDAGITGEKNLGEINKNSVMGIGIAALVRVFLFLAILGVVVTGVTLDSGNPAVLLVLAGAFNGLILPITLSICLIASQNKKIKIMGTEYKHASARIRRKAAI